MRIDSCRTCGEDMQEFQRCDECNEVTSMICRSCNRTSESIVHANCGTIDGRLILN